MIYLLNIFVLLVLSFLSVSFLPHLRILGALPILPIFFIIPLAYFRKGFEPLILAAFTGIFFDLFSTLPFGFYLVFFLALAAVIRYLFQEGMHHLPFGRYFLFVAIAIIVFEGAQLGFVLNTVRAAIIWPVVAFLAVNFIFAIIFYIFVNWYFEFLFRLGDKLKRR